ncbi:MAG: caspase family protein, partial [Bryobacteraceae bacterium]
TLSIHHTNHIYLFDSTLGHVALDRAIAEFLDAHQTAKNLIVYYCGHGDFLEGKEYFLALRDTRRDNPYFTSYPIKSLAGTLKEHARYLSRYLVLDSCFSAAAFDAFMSAAPSQVVLQQAREEFEPADTPGVGTALLCAASRRDAAVAPPDSLHTMFTWALLEVLQGEGVVHETLSLAQVHDRVWPVMQRHFGASAVRPELHNPSQQGGVVGNRPIFPTLNSAVADGPETAEGEEFRDAIRQGLESPSEDSIQCVVVIAEQHEDAAAFPLREHVRRAFEHYDSEIRTSFGRYRRVYRGAAKITEEPKPESLRVTLLVLRVQDAFESEDALRRSVEAMCRADIAIFDITGQEPGVMMFLGVRSVARRGVTISSLGGEYLMGAELDLPFNIQTLNVVFHSAKQQQEGRDPLHLIGSKIHTGFDELAKLPFYLDLPAYDSVRRLGRDPASYRPLRFNEQVLVLCPFNGEYTKRNWATYLTKELPSRLKAEAKKLFPEGNNVAPPRLVRLLDMDTPRLVAQTLFESIRRTEMCIVDWTQLRANVMFELGVRLAVNPLGAVHIIEQGAPVDGACRYAKQMIELFNPIYYQCVPGKIKAYNQMMERFVESLNPSRQDIQNLVYRTAAAAFDVRSDPVAMPIVEELESAAELLASEDEERSGISQALFSESNKQVLEQVQAAAAARRLAAWSFIHCSYPPETIRSTPDLVERYRKLGALVRSWLTDHPDPYVDNLIKEGLRTVRMTSRTGGAKA